MRRNSFKLAKKPQNLSQDENAIVLVVIREKKLTFLLSPQANLRSGDLRLPFCLGDEKKKAPYRRLTTGRPDVLYVNTGNNKASGFMGPRKRVEVGLRSRLVPNKLILFYHYNIVYVFFLVNFQLKLCFRVETIIPCRVNLFLLRVCS